MGLKISESDFPSDHIEKSDERIEPINIEGLDERIGNYEKSEKGNGRSYTDRAFSYYAKQLSQDGSISQNTSNTSIAERKRANINDTSPLVQSAKALANTPLGDGGGNQYFINDAQAMKKSGSFKRESFMELTFTGEDGPEYQDIKMPPMFLPEIFQLIPLRSLLRNKQNGCSLMRTLWMKKDLLLLWILSQKQ